MHNRRFPIMVGATALMISLGAAAPAAAQIKIQIPGFGSGKSINPLKELEKKKRKEDQEKKKAVREREKKLKSIDQEIRSGLRSIPTEFGGKVKYEKQKLDRAMQRFKKAKPMLTAQWRAMTAPTRVSIVFAWPALRLPSPAMSETIM